jgi:hypothetical protein
MFHRQSAVVEEFVVPGRLTEGQMRVGVDEARHHGPAGRVDPLDDGTELRGSGRRGRADAGDDAVFDHHVALGNSSGAGAIDQSPTADVDASGHRFSAPPARAIRVRRRWLGRTPFRS